MITALFLKGRLRHALSDREKMVLEDAIDKPKVLKAREVLAHKGELMETSTYLIEGFMLRYIDGVDGDRQIVCIHVPGDFVDLHAFAMKRLDHDVAALNQASIAQVRHSVLQEIMDDEPHLSRILWFSTLLDAAMHREWIYRVGRLSAEQRLAHLICELYDRMNFVSMVNGSRLNIPLTQQDIAWACGLTPIHINRIAASLREKKIATLMRPEIEIHDLQHLRDMCQFDSAYLYGDGQLKIADELDDRVS